MTQPLLPSLTGLDDNVRAWHVPQPLRWLNERFASPLSPQKIVVYLSIYLVLAANWPLWFQLARIGGGAPSLYMRPVAIMAVLIFFGTVAILSLTAWTRGMRLVWIGVTLSAAMAQYYMLNYSTVMDPGMAANVLQTDRREVADLLGWHLFFSVSAVMLLPNWWILKVQIPRVTWWKQILRNVLMLVLALAAAAAVIAATARDFAPLMRNHPQLRYMLNPIASIYSTGAVLVRPLFARSSKLVPISAGTVLGATHAGETKPVMFVLVVGETGRADHFGLNGYNRNTTPGLAARDVLNWKSVHSCGTSTLASVPCMFSHLGREEFVGRKNDYETLMDVVQASGMSVLWIDNQSGCKGVCDRVPHVSASEGLNDAQRKQLCDASGECRDMAMLSNLQERIDAMPHEQRSKGVFLVLHQMGSHGPAYSKRSSESTKQFKPECTTEVLADCGHGELMNAYDNSILETDKFLSATIDWLKTQSGSYNTGMLYVSDHGESLGEYGQFLHGLPYGVAPDVQKHVPMVAWLAPGLLQREQISTSCLRATESKAYTHDNLYHSMLGILDVTTPTYQPALDLFGACKGDAVAASR